jgi:ubiquitin-small subunit ribosomal protein S27Ae
MATKKGGSSGDKKGKKPHKNKPTSKKYKHYTIDGESIKKSKSCPRCGPGVFLAQHKNRLYCGKCKYAEFSGSQEQKDK